MIEFLNIIEQEINKFDKKFKNILSTKASLLYKVNTYLSNTSGKKIRPICCIVSSGILNNITEKTYRGAILIELLHTATLVHDDVVDDANIRRSALSINTIWKNKISVLTGDYFLAKGLKLAVKNKDYDMLNFISSVVEKIVEGELLQIEKTKKLNLNEEDYFKIIKLKTGALFECAFKLGAISANANTNDVQKLGKLGLIIGILFQIKDDILDYSKSNYSGKKSGNDIREGKINLPLLYSLKRMNLIEKNKVFRILRKKTNTTMELDLVQKMVIQYKGIEHAQLLIQKQQDAAFEIVDCFEEGKYKEVIALLLNFLIERSK